VVNPRVAGRITPLGHQLVVPALPTGRRDQHGDDSAVRLLPASRFCSTIPSRGGFSGQRFATVSGRRTSSTPCVMRWSWRRSTKTRLATWFSELIAPGSSLSWLCWIGLRVRR